MKVFVDCDVLLDAGLTREPFCKVKPRNAGLEALAGEGWHAIKVWGMPTRLKPLVPRFLIIISATEKKICHFPQP
jgi:hypothetical protein